MNCQTTTRLPERAHSTDAGADLFSAESRSIPGLLRVLIDTFNHITPRLGSDRAWRLQMESLLTQLSSCLTMIGTGTQCELPPGHVGLLCDKSGLGGRGIKIFGGVIDEGYSGEVMVGVINFGTSDWKIEKGVTKVTQLLVMPINYVEIIDSSVSGGERGIGKWGSSDD